MDQVLDLGSLGTGENEILSGKQIVFFLAPIWIPICFSAFLNFSLLLNFSASLCWSASLHCCFLLFSFCWFLRFLFGSFSVSLSSRLWVSWFILFFTASSSSFLCLVLCLFWLLYLHCFKLLGRFPIVVFHSSFLCICANYIGTFSLNMSTYPKQTSKNPKQLSRNFKP